MPAVKNTIAELLIRSMLREMAPEERSELEEWRGQSADNEKISASLTSLRELKRKLQSFYAAGADKASNGKAAERLRAFMPLTEMDSSI